MRNADRITAALLLIASLGFSGAALKFYAWWGPGGPGPGFMPFWLGMGMALLALVMLVRSLREKDRGEEWLPRGQGLRHMLVVLAASIAFVALLKIIGMVLATALFLAFLVRYLGRHRWWVTFATAIGAAAFNWLVFVHWLHVPFPTGPLGF